MLDKYVITDLPMPPTENQIYSDTVRGRLVRRYLNKTGKDYKRDVSRILIEGGHVTPLREFVESHIEVEIHIYLFKPNWLTLSGKPNRNAGDASNRIKIAQDILFETIGLDDSHAFCTSVRKLNGAERMNIVLTPASVVADYF